MLYRKSPPVPTRLLLRVVATAGAGALLGMAGCSSNAIVETTAMSDASDADHPFVGSIVLPGDAMAVGVTPNPGPCTINGHEPCGVVVHMSDAGESGDASTAGDAATASDGSDAGPERDGDVTDAATDAHFCCGVIIRPDQ